MKIDFGNIPAFNRSMMNLWREAYCHWRDELACDEPKPAWLHALCVREKNRSLTLLTEYANMVRGDLYGTA